jgi:SAM-dependent methyltransferase
MKDRFSSHANQYAQFRPTYPPALYEFLYQHVQHFDAAWDCGTGNGQAARDLSNKFKKVFATDLSAKQLENAYQSENIVYSIANEKSSFADNSFDLITVAQAAHWFNMEAFSEEVKRVSKPGGVVALWGYGLLSIHPEIDLLIHHFYTQTVGLFWDKERRHIDEHYKNLYFPFQEIQSPAFIISVTWTLPELEGYLTTWSAVQKYIAMHNLNPVDNLISQIKIHWKDERQTINFPLFMKIGRVEK